MSEKNLKYWQEKLSKKLPVLEIATDYKRSSNQQYRIGIETFVFSQELLQSLTTISQEYNVNLFSALLTAFNCLIYRYTTQEDIIVGSYISQTNNLDFNILAFRNYISGSSSFSQLLKQHEQAVSQDLEYQDFSWKQLVQELIPNNPGIFQVMFNLQDALLTDTPLPININEYELDLSFFVVSSKEGLKGTVVYNQELFEPQTIQRMIGHFENLLNSIVENPDSKVNELEILSEIERHKILVEWNQTQLDYPPDKCIHKLFEEQVAKTPDAVALIWKDQQLTYQQLDNRANQLANYLQTLGIKPDSKVGICIERCLEMVIGILGILKAGGAYVPL
ncbi:MAG: condensation domain-containing protein, partial [Cyanobacteria bacterium J06573_2]